MEIIIYAQGVDWVIKQTNSSFPKHYPSRQIALDAARKIGRETGARLVLYERDKPIPTVYDSGSY